MAIEVTKVYKEQFPALRFIGKRYTNSDRNHRSILIINYKLAVEFTIELSVSAWYAMWGKSCPIFGHGKKAIKTGGN